MDIERIIKYIKEASETMTVQDLADKSGYSVTYLSRAFKKEVGISPSEYIQAVKREKAIEEIISSDKTILSSQLKAGYLSQGTFTNLIKKAMSASPKQLSMSKTETLTAYNESKENYTPGEIIAPYDLRVKISTEEPFEGIVFVGLFKKPIPDRPPVIGIPLLNYPKKDYVDFRHIPDGSYYVLACVIHKTLDPRKLFVLKDNLRGRVETRLDFPHTYDCELVLRPPHISDPPITLNLPKMFIEVVRGRTSEFRSD